MQPELTPEQKFNAESPERMVFRALLQGQHRDDIVADLLRLDWTPDAARSLVERVARDIERYRASPESRARLVRECRMQMIGGLLMALLGILASAISAFAALGGFIPVWFLLGGVILAGFLLASRGFSRWRLYRSAAPCAHD